MFVFLVYPWCTIALLAPAELYSTLKQEFFIFVAPSICLCSLAPSEVIYGPVRLCWCTLSCALLAVVGITTIPLYLSIIAFFCTCRCGWHHHSSLLVPTLGRWHRIVAGAVRCSPPSTCAHYLCLRVGLLPALGILALSLWLLALSHSLGGLSVAPVFLVNNNCGLVGGRFWPSLSERSCSADFTMRGGPHGAVATVLLVDSVGGGDDVDVFGGSPTLGDLASPRRYIGCISLVRGQTDIRRECLTLHDVLSARLIRPWTNGLPMGMDTARTSVDVMVLTMAVGLLVVYGVGLVAHWPLLWCGACCLVISMMTCRPRGYFCCLCQRSPALGMRYLFGDAAPQSAPLPLGNDN